jgi:uncharacterized membrane protein
MKSENQPFGMILIGFLLFLTSSFGLSVHMKIYPIIYLIAFLMFLEKKKSFDSMKSVLQLIVIW